SSYAYTACVGGICGYNSGGISDCYSTGDVFASSSSSPATATTYAGGICGRGESSKTSNCYNTGDVFASSAATAYAGGIRVTTQTN
ncbi:MAG: hypothetical protein LBI04_11590, partial [Treponema sp.]|nr:hypothetical protein [Treponema sp.]